MSLCFAVVLLSPSPLLRSLLWLLFANIDFADIERFSVIFLGDKLSKSSHDPRKGRDCGMRIRDFRLLGSLSVPLPYPHLRLSLVCRCGTKRFLCRKFQLYKAAAPNRNWPFM